MLQFIGSHLRQRLAEVQIHSRARVRIDGRFLPGCRHPGHPPYLQVDAVAQARLPASTAIDVHEDRAILEFQAGNLRPVARIYRRARAPKRLPSSGTPAFMWKPFFPAGIGWTTRTNSPDMNRTISKRDSGCKGSSLLFPGLMSGALCCAA